MKGIREESAKKRKKREAEIDDNAGGSDGDDSLKAEKAKKKKKKKQQQKVEHGGEISTMAEQEKKQRKNREGEIDDKAGCSDGDNSLNSEKAKKKQQKVELGGQISEMEEPKRKRKERKNREVIGSYKSNVENFDGIGAGDAADNGDKKKKKKRRDQKDSFVGTVGDKIKCERERLDENPGVKKKTKKKKKDMGSDSGAKDSTTNKLCEKTVDRETEQVAMEGVENSRNDVKGKNKKDKKKSSDLGGKNQVAVESLRKGGSHKGVQRGGNPVEKTDSGHDSAKKRTKKGQQIDLGAEEDTEMSNKETKKKWKTNQNEDSGHDENVVEPERDVKRKKKRKRKQSENEEDETPSLGKSAKKVKFSDQVEVFPLSDVDADLDGEEEESDKDGLVRGKRFSKEEDEIVRQAVLEYIDDHGLGEEGINMIMNCRSHRAVKNCWKEIGAAIPWRPKDSVYYRAHLLFERDPNRSWTPEELELVKRFAEKHGSDWKTLADVVGKHRLHVKDAWRRLKFPKMNRAKWSREEYQTLFDLVNLDLRMKAFEEKKSKHGMLRDNVPWSAISDKLGTRNHSVCCMKWYNQLTSPLVAEGMWDNTDDYRLLNELLKLDACCIEDVDWDSLLENRSGDVCQKRWNQMVLHIGQPGTKSFPELVEILAKRYCPELAGVREEFDNRPFVP